MRTSNIRHIANTNNKFSIHNNIITHIQCHTHIAKAKKKHIANIKKSHLAHCRARHGARKNNTYINYASITIYKDYTCK